MTSILTSQVTHHHIKISASFNTSFQHRKVEGCGVLLLVLIMLAVLTKLDKRLISKFMCNVIGYIIGLWATYDVKKC